MGYVGQNIFDVGCVGQTFLRAWVKYIFARVFAWVKIFCVGPKFLRGSNFFLRGSNFFLRGSAFIY